MGAMKTSEPWILLKNLGTRFEVEANSTAHLSPILILLASYSFVITINPPFFTVHVTHS